MKAIRSMTFAALALAGTGSAYSQTVIHIVASNGDRTATQTAISKLLAPGWTFNGVNGYTTQTGTLATATGANFGSWNGTYAGTQVIIKVAYSGALAGISAVAGNTDQKFAPTNGTNDGTVLNPLTTSTFQIAKADFGFSTNFQSTSPFNGTYQGVTYTSPIVEEIVGVSPLGFYASPGFPSGGANITTQLAQLLYTTGTVSLQLFTGNAADRNKTVWAIGRNTDAGQRFGALTEIGLGTSSGIKVWQPSITGTTTASGITYGGVANSLAPWPAESPSGIFSAVGNGGYSSGALLAEVLTTTLGPAAYKGTITEEGETFDLFPNATGGYFVGYVTPGDANNRILGQNNVVPPANRGVALSYNGVPLTDANVKNGKYTAWLYNRILKSPTFNNTPSFKLNFANALKVQVSTVDAPSGGGLFDNEEFTVKRFTDGGLVVPK